MSHYKDLVAKLEKTVHQDVAKAQTPIEQILGGKIRLTPESLFKLAETAVSASIMDMVAGARFNHYLIFRVPLIDLIESKTDLQNTPDTSWY